MRSITTAEPLYLKFPIPMPAKKQGDSTAKTKGKASQKAGARSAHGQKVREDLYKDQFAEAAESGKFCGFEEACTAEECILQKCGPRATGKIPSHFPNYLTEYRLVFALPDCGRVMALGWVRMTDTYLVLTLNEAVLV